MRALRGLEITFILQLIIYTLAIGVWVSGQGFSRLNTVFLFGLFYLLIIPFGLFYKSYINSVSAGQSAQNNWSKFFLVTIIIMALGSLPLVFIVSLLRNMVLLARA